MSVQMNESPCKKRGGGKLSLQFYLLIFTFAVMLVTALLLYALWCIFDGMPWWQRDRDGVRLTILMLLAASVIISLSLVRIFSNKLLFSSARALSDASRRVARGDFSARLPMPKEKELCVVTESFNEMVEKLGCQQMLASSFISNVSHEFRNPLSAIRGYAQLLESDALTPAERAEYCAVIEDKTLALSKLVSSILELSRLENQNAAPELTRFWLDEQIRKNVLTCEAAWSGKQLAMEVSLAPVEYEGPQELLSQVWQNLIDNAVKFTPEGGRVSVFLIDARDEAIVRVADSGCGMDAATQARMFDKFYQGETGHSGEGNGLGLSIVQSVLALCDAKISVDSTPGEGTTIEVRLAKRQRPPQASAPEVC